jgi:hypothetical protein
MKATERAIEHLLTVAHAAGSPSPEQQLRSLERLEAGIQPLTLVPGAGPFERASPPSAELSGALGKARWFGLQKALLWGGCVAALGVGLGYFFWGRDALDTASPPAQPMATLPPVPDATASAPRSVAPAVTPDIPPASFVDEANAPVSKPATKRARVKLADRAAPAARPWRARAPDLHEALRLLQRAQQALRDGNPKAASEDLDQLDSKVAREVLAEERLVARILTLCALGERPQAELLTREMLAAQPGSVYRGRIERSCAGTDSAALLQAELLEAELLQAELLEEMRRRTPN